MFWAVAGRTQAAEGKLATSFFAAEIGLDPITAFAKNSGALDYTGFVRWRQKQKAKNSAHGSNSITTQSLNSN
ncbi:MAG: hypothetical protein FJ190_06720 [Gammaproteobacteria bacterium]|nr:hypothetical protein [Gammaproteobacteria bacterium]